MNAETPTQRLIHALESGQEAHFCGMEGDGACPQLDVVNGEQWGDDRVLDGSTIYQAVTEKSWSDQPNHHRGLRIHGARIEGPLDLSWVTFEWPLVFHECYFTAPLMLESATLGELDLSGSRVHRLEAPSMVARGSVLLDGTQVVDVVEMDAVTIGGRLKCTDGTFNGHGHHAIQADGATIDAGVLLNGDFSAEGEVKLLSAKVGTQLNCHGGTFINPDGDALSLDGADIDGAAFLTGGFTSEGQVRLPGVHVGVHLICNGATFTNPNGRAISAGSIQVDGSIHLDGVSAEGEVHLTGANVGGQLVCSDSSFTNPDGSALTGNRATISGGAVLNDGFQSSGEVRMVGAHIGGQLLCSGGTFTNPDGNAIEADGCTVGGSVFLTSGFRAEGEVRLIGLNVGGQLSCHGATFINPDGDALSLDGADIESAVFLTDGFTCEGQVRLLGTIVGVHLFCNGGSFINPGGNAINGESLQVGNNLRLDGIEAKGQLRLPDARIGGRLVGTNAALSNPDRTAFKADRATISAGASLDRQFHADGAVRLLGAEIGGSLSCVGGTFNNPGGKALAADRAHVNGSVLLSHDITAQGEVRLPAAKIGGQLACDGANFSNPEGRALFLDDVQVEGDVFLRRGFTANGQVSLIDASMTGLYCQDGMIAKPSGNALRLDRASVAASAYLGNVSGNVRLLGTRVAEVLDLRSVEAAQFIDLVDAEVGTLRDRTGSWPEQVRLEGFVYRHIEGEGPQDEPITVEDRIQWLERNVRAEGEGVYSPRPYRQLASVYRATGMDRQARQVAIANRQAYRRQLGGRPHEWPARLWNYFLGATVGYGYRPWYAAYWLLGSWALSFWIVAMAHPSHVHMARDGAPSFNPLVFALDVLAPVIDLGQRSSWQVSGAGYRLWSWLAVLAGWALTTALVVGISSALRRE